MGALRRFGLFSALLVASCSDDGLVPVDDTPGETDVDPGDIVGILVSPDKIVIPLGEEVQLGATALEADRTSTDVTSAAEWGSSDDDVVRVDEGLDREGILIGEAVGEARVWAEIGGVRSPDVKVTVTDAALLGLTVEPAAATVPAGGTITLKATAAFSNGERSDATPQVQWVTADGGTARVGAGGALEGVSTGSTEVYAEWQGKRSAAIPVTVVQNARPDLYIAELIGDASGGSLTLTVRVANDGNVGVNETWLDFFVDPESPPSPGDYGSEWVNAGYVDADGTVEVTTTYDLEPGSHEIYIVVDTDNAVEESDEDNNALGQSFSLDGGAGGPNLRVGSFEAIADEVSVYWFLEVTNAGGEDVGSFFVDLYVDQPMPPEVPSDGDEFKKIESLAAGASTTVDYLVDRECYGCKSWVLLDSYDQVPETNENDNTAGPVYVYPW